MSPPVIDPEKCKCSPKFCIDQCPLDILHLNQRTDMPEVRYPDECWHCRSCRDGCPSGAITFKLPLSMLL
jgi:adenylylsulfate reductase subunit B